MSKIGDKFLNIFGLNDEEYDDFEDDFEDDEFDDIIEPKQNKFEKKQKEKFSAFEDDDDETLRKTVSKASVSHGEKNKSFIKPSSASKIVPMKTAKGNGLEVCVIKPSSIEDSREISDTIISGRAVILNLEGLHVETAQRIIDFCSGSCYAISGNLQKVSSYIFIVTPETVDISGDFQELFGGSGSGSGFDIPL